MIADLLLIGGSFFCGKGLDNDIDFVAVKGNRIVGLGKESEAAEYIGETTTVKRYDKSDLIMPGFYDSHGHIELGGVATKYPNYGDCKSEEETALKVKEYADSHPDEEWVFGVNWYQVFWGQKEFPTRESLDKYCPDHPVMIADSEGHGVWVNSLALEKAGITKETKAPPFGRIEKDENGEPTGYLSEMAIGLVAKVAYDLPAELEKMFIKEYMKQAREFGIVAANDMWPYYGKNTGNPRVFSELSKDSELTMRIHAAANLFKEIDSMGELGEEYNDDMFRVCLMKAFIDGVPTTHTALMLEPYEDMPSTKGGTLCDLDELKQKIFEAHSKGISVRLHCCGDGAVHYAIECFSQAKEKYGETGSRHAVEHFETSTMEDIEKAAKAGVIASMQPEHLAMTEAFDDNPYLVNYNDRQKDFSWAFKTIMDAGVNIAFGTDYPVVTNNPFVTIYRAATRLHNDGMPKGGWNPKEKLDMEDILHCYTLNGYYGVNRENELGTIETGKLADIIVINQNLFEIPAERIKDTEVKMTIVDGKIVYEKR